MTENKNQWYMEFAEKLTQESSGQLHAEVLDSGRGDLEIKGLNIVFEEAEYYNWESKEVVNQLLHDLKIYNHYADENNGVLTIEESLEMLQTSLLAEFE